MQVDGLCTMGYTILAINNKNACTVNTKKTLGTTSTTQESSSVTAASLDDACNRAHTALAACRPPLPPSAPAFNVTSTTSTTTPTHTPGREAWVHSMQSVHDSLDHLNDHLNEADDDAVTAESDVTVTKGDAGEDATTSTTTATSTTTSTSTIEEWLRGGQGSLDDLLAVLDGGTQFWGETASDSNSLTKVVMARTSEIPLHNPLDPLDLLAVLQQSRDPRCYQFAMLPEPGVAFFGSSPEQLFARSGSAVASEAVAATRPRGAPGDVQGDFWLALDLLRCGKDHREFSVVRDWVRDSLKQVCTRVVVEREKSVLKQGAVQHLYGKLAGVLQEGCGDAELLVCCVCFLLVVEGLVVRCVVYCCVLVKACICKHLCLFISCTPTSLACTGCITPNTCCVWSCPWPSPRGAWST